MIVAIDGPAGSGKSSVSRALAQALGFRFLDTGAMYRSVALAAIRKQLDLTDSDALAELVKHLDIDLSTDRVTLNGEDITDAIRSPEVTDAVRFVADNLQVRATLSALQRHIAYDGKIVTEGRDQATVVFPDAECKIFLTASPEERARRRQSELASKGVDISVEETLRQLQERDEHDERRPVGGLHQAKDAIVVSTDNLTAKEVLAHLVHLVRKKQDEQ